MWGQNAQKRLVAIRIALDAVIFVCVFIAPFWATAIIAVLGALFFRQFYEIIAFGVLIDALYLPTFSDTTIAPMILSALAAYLAVLFIKPRLRLFA